MLRKQTDEETTKPIPINNKLTTYIFDKKDNTNNNNNNSTEPKIFIEEIINIINEFIKTDNNLFICNKYLYSCSYLKYYKLNSEYSEKYCFDPDFRKLIKSKIKYSRSQLSLNLSNNDEITDKDIKDLGPLYYLNLTNCVNITNEGIKSLNNICILNVSNCHQITDDGIKDLTNIDVLNLGGCEQITYECMIYVMTKNIIIVFDYENDDSHYHNNYHSYDPDLYPEIYGYNPDNDDNDDDYDDDYDYDDDSNDDYYDNHYNDDDYDDDDGDEYNHHRHRCWSDE
jgi:hypothetical protein